MHTFTPGDLVTTSRQAGRWQIESLLTREPDAPGRAVLTPAGHGATRGRPIVPLTTLQLAAEESAAPLLVWVDVETTGLDPWDNHDELLEIAVLVTDASGNLVDEHGYHAVVHYDAEESVALYDHADDTVRQMHTRTGLWGRLASGIPLGQVEDEVLAYVQQWAVHPRQARLAGSSVALDRKFLEAKLPRLEQWLHYRVLDVSSNRFLLGALGHFGGPNVGKTPTHTAFDDIRGSLDEYRWQLDVLRGELA